jgi:predicted AAA+ superfamily ATPase
MINKEILRKIIKDQKKNLDYKKSLTRQEFKDLKIEMPFAIIISGIRRCGKSTLLRQKMSNLKNFYYLNFEDPRLVNFELSDFEKADEIFIEEYGKSKYYFFDEIQNIPKWEIKVRHLLDNKNFVVLTGSNASLLSKELGTKLTGRNLRYELFPFSYSEFLSFKNLKPSINSFEKYLIKGGFPEYLKFDKDLILQDLLSDILNRDILARYNLKNSKALKNLTNYLLTNPSKEFSQNNLKKMLNMGSVNSIISFIKYLEDSYLIFTINKFEYSLKKTNN